MALQVRERPPLRLSVNVTPGTAQLARWGMDEPDPQNAPSGMTFSTTMPGGFDQLNTTLAREPSANYPDLGEFATITVNGVGGQVAWQGRLETSPRTSGDQISISPGAVGWQAALDDDGSAQMIYIDQDLTQWGSPSTARQVALLGVNVQLASSNAAADPTSGAPAVIQTITDSWATPFTPANEAWYDAGPGNLIQQIHYALSVQEVTNTNWLEEIFLSSDANASTVEGSGNLHASAPTAAYFLPTTPLRFGILQHQFVVTNSGAAGAAYSAYWKGMAVYGPHGLTGRGQTDPAGFIASDIVAHAVSTWAPVLQLADTGGASTITPTAFVIPQATYPTPTTAGSIIQDVTKYELLDWAVWEGPTFWMNARNGRGRSWRARVGPSGLSETGPQVDRIYNQVAVIYTDVSGATLMVGPDTDSTLIDSDPSNPATLAGLTRCFIIPNIGVSVAGAASQVGQAFLVEQKAISTAGQAQITGYVQDDHGVTYPAWMIRAGDNITFVDAHDPVPRRIVRTSYSDDTKTNQLDLDSPPEGLQALLARLAVVTTNLS